MDPANSSHDDEKIEQLKRGIYSRTISERLGMRPRRTLKEGPVRVGEEWVHHDEPLSPILAAPMTLAAPRAALKWFLIAAAAFFVLATGIFAYYFFLGAGSSPASNGNIDIQVSGPTQVSGGDPTELQISVSNRNRAALQLSDLVITYPKGTRSPADLVTDLPNQRISLGTIEPGGRRLGTVSAVFSGSEGDHANVHVELEYRLPNSNSIFVASQDYVLTFVSSPLSVSVEAASETTSGQPMPITVTVSSNAQTIVRDVVLKADYPFGFTQKSSDTPPKVAGFWELGDFAPGQSKSIKIQGVLQGQKGDERIFRFTAGLRNDRSDTEVATTLADFEEHVALAEPFLALSITVNKEGGEEAVVVSPGDTVNLSIQWQNNLSTPIDDAVFVASLGGILIDGTLVRSADGFYRSADNAVLWDKNTSHGALAELPPGGKGTVSVSFQIPAAAQIGNTRNPQIAVTVHAAGKRVGQSGVPETLQSAATRVVKVASNIQLAAQGVYYSNPFGSTGPLPPKAGQETTYLLLYTLQNSSNKITGAKISAILPAYVRWIGVYSPGSERLTFNQTDSSVVWDIGDIAQGLGAASTTPRRVAFEIGFTPSSSQVGSQPILLSSIVLTGTDAFTGAPVSVSAKDITSNLTTSDPGFTADKATVVP